MRKKVIAAVIVVALVGGGWWYMTDRAESAQAASKVQYVPAVVRKGDIQSSISGTGAIQAANGVDVAAEQSGTLIQLLVTDRDQVQAGQVLAVLENKTVEANLKQAQLDYQSALTSLESLINPQTTEVRQQQLKVESARLTLQQRQQDVANLKVTASQGGIVSSVKVTEGSDVTANTLLLTLYDQTTPTFVVPVSQEAATAVRPGHKATVAIAGFGNLEGAVRQVGETATPATGNKDATVPVAIDLPVVEGLRPGMVGQVNLVVPGLTYYIQGYGSVEDDSQEVRVQVAGRVALLAVSEGARVKAGDLLVQLTDESLLTQEQQAELDLKLQEENLQNLINPGGDPSGQLAKAQMQVEQSSLTLSNREDDVQNLRVKAPVAGQVSGLSVQVGDKLSANQQLLRVADYGAMQVTISVDELDIANVKVGQATTVTLDALPDKTYQGKVVKVNPEGVSKNDIATFEVTVQIENPDGLMAGMSATVTVTVEERLGVLWVPAQAVSTQKGKSYVQLLVNGQPVQTEVQVGTKTSQRVEITGGVEEGAQVVLTTVQSTTSQTQTQTGLGGGIIPGAGPTGDRQFKDGSAPAGR